MQKIISCMPMRVYVYYLIIFGCSSNAYSMVQEEDSHSPDGYFEGIEQDCINLVEEDSPINIKNSATLILHHLAALNTLPARQFLSILRTLQSLFPDCINRQDKNGNTPLHWAVEAKNKEVIKILVQEGCNYSIKNYAGRSAYCYAQWRTSEKFEKNGDAGAFRFIIAPFLRECIEKHLQKSNTYSCPKPEQDAEDIKLFYKFLKAKERKKHKVRK